MNIDFRIFSGPNIHAPRRLVRITLDLADDAVAPPEFLAALFERLPALREDRELADAGPDSGAAIGRAYGVPPAVIADRLAGFDIPAAPR